MICRHCLQRASALARRAPLRRTFSTTFPSRNAATTSATVSPSPATAGTTDFPTPVLTTPLASSPDAPPALSSCPPGTVLSGLNYFKGKEDPVAKADDEYPAWLWRCLDAPKKAGAEEGEEQGDEFSKSKKQRRLAAKKKQQHEAKLLASGDVEALAPKIPLQQQSINLPDGQGEGEPGGVEGSVLAAQKREELRRAMRRERKVKIKEVNYLKTL